MHRITILLILISINFLYAQSFSLKEKKSLLFNLQKSNQIFEVLKDSSKENNLKNFPLRLGVEFIGVFTLKKNTFGLLGLLGFCDISLSDRLFLKTEYGRFFIKIENNKNFSFLSFGLNWKLLVINRNNELFLYPALLLAGPISSPIISGFLSIRYLHKLSKYFGVGCSLRYPFISFELMSFSVGIQFKTE